MKRRLICMILFAMALPLFASCAPQSGTESGVSAPETSSSVPSEPSELTAGANYFYSFSDALTVIGDKGDELTDGDDEAVKLRIKDVSKTFGDWNGATHTTTLFEEKPTYFYLECDLGFPCYPTEAKLSFDTSGNIPEKVELYRSDDGYNYSFYLGEAEKSDGAFSYSFGADTAVKSIKFVVYAPAGKQILMTGLSVKGKRLSERILLSQGAAYSCSCAAPDSMKLYEDNGTRLTDGENGDLVIRNGKYSVFTPTEKDALMNRSVVPITVDLGSVMNVSEVCTNFLQVSGVSSIPDFVSVQYSLDGTEYKDFSMSFERGKTGAQSRFIAMRNHTVKARYLKVNVFSSSNAALDEIAVYGSHDEVASPAFEFPQTDSYTDLPVIRGGFYGFFIDYVNGYNPHHYFDEHRIFLQLKGFRELGMDTLVIGAESMSYEQKITLCETPAALAEKGYRKGVGHGVYDLNEAILSAADELGMKVYVSTLSSLPYPSLPAGDEAKEAYIDAVLEEAEIIIPYIYEKYSSHQSLAGFYLTDETCDWWLAQERAAGTSYTRKLYKGQSDIIRSLDGEMKIAIAPAAWRSDTPSGFGDSLYKLIKSDTDGGRPVADIVFVQDCLGREATLTVPENVYEKYAEYLASCKAGVEKAGATFGNDTEIFDIGYRIKRFDEIIRSVSLECHYSDNTIVYDLTHYFSQQGRGSFNAYAYFDNDYVCLQYAKYLRELDK